MPPPNQLPEQSPAMARALARRAAAEEEAKLSKDVAGSLPRGSIDFGNAIEKIDALINKRKPDAEPPTKTLTLRR